jgi:hypothetical protein
MTEFISGSDCELLMWPLSLRGDHQLGGLRSGHLSGQRGGDFPGHLVDDPQIVSMATSSSQPRSKRAALLRAGCPPGRPPQLLFTMKLSPCHEKLFCGGFAELGFQLGVPLRRREPATRDSSDRLRRGRRRRWPELAARAVSTLRSAAALQRAERRRPGCAALALVRPTRAFHRVETRRATRRYCVAFERRPELAAAGAARPTRGVQIPARCRAANCSSSSSPRDEQRLNECEFHVQLTAAAAYYSKKSRGQNEEFNTLNRRCRQKLAQALDG